jgi:hypothetical protein
MTTLELVLTAIIWIAYGCFNFNESPMSKSKKDDDLMGGAMFCILFAPVILAIRLIWGIFSSKFFEKW